MENKIQDLIKKAYAAFNARDIDTALSTMHPDVQWPKHLKEVMQVGIMR